MTSNIRLDCTCMLHAWFIHNSQLNILIIFEIFLKNWGTKFKRMVYAVVVFRSKVIFSLLHSSLSSIHAEIIRSTTAEQNVSCCSPDNKKI